MRQITLAGDWHGYLPHARWVLEWSRERGIETVFQVGDFGLWEHERSGVDYLDGLQVAADEFNVDVYCLAGNHDNEKLALQLHAADFDGEGFVLLRPRVKFAARGHRWTWEGTRFIALGGAYSVDKQWRVQSEDWRTRKSREAHEKYGAAFHDFTETMWFPDEQLTDENVTTATDDDTPVDVMLTHDKPLRSAPGWNRKDLVECKPNQERIQRVVDELHPLLLAHGHLHYPYHDVIYDDTGVYGTYVIGIDADSSAMSGESNYDKNNSVAVLNLDGGLQSVTFQGDVKLEP